MANEVPRPTLTYKDRLEWGWRRAGAWYFFQGVKHLLRIKVYRVWVANGPDHAFRAGLPKQLPKEYQTRLMEPIELVQYAKPENDLSIEFLEESQVRGDECTVSFYEGEVVGYLFTALKRTRVTDELDILIPSGHAYGYKSWTHRDHRRKGLTGVRLRVKQDWRDKTGNKRPKTVWYMEYHNYPSMLNNNYRPPHERPLYLGVVCWARWFGRVFVYNGRRAKWMGVVLIRKGEPPIKTYPYT